ncbi:MAG: transketolase [Alphaproteobacteria bacterium]|nr:transketolase [Alphaproteobacteria bacterium]
MRNAFASEITAMAAEDPRVVLLSGDIGNRLFDDLRGRFPDRFINCGVAEANMMGVAAGLAMSGLRPVVYTITPFTTTRCLEQIRVDVAYHEAPVVIVGTGAGLAYADLGPTHHSLEDFAIFRAIPNLQVVAPWDSPSLRSLLRDAVQSGKPTYMRIGKKGEKDIPAGEPLKIGQVRETRSGSDVCILAVGTIAPEALKAADQIKTKFGLSCRVVLIGTVKPFSLDALKPLLTGVKTVVTVEEHAKTGGFGEQFAAAAAQSGLDLPITCLGAHDEFMHQVGTQSYARAFFGIDAAAIAAAVRSALPIAA